MTVYIYTNIRFVATAGWARYPGFRGYCGHAIQAFVATVPSKTSLFTTWKPLGTRKCCSSLLLSHRGARKGCSTQPLCHRGARKSCSSLLLCHRGAQKACSSLLLCHRAAQRGVREGVQRNCSNKLCSVALLSVTLRSASLYSVRGYARDHTSTLEGFKIAAFQKVFSR